MAKSKVQFFDSATEFATHVDRVCKVAAVNRDEWNTGLEFHGRRGDDALRLVSEGDAAHGAAVAKLLNTMHVEAPTDGHVWTPGVAGPLPIVPAAIAGLPDCMLFRDHDRSSAAPVRIFASCCMSAGCEQATFTARGAAIMALAVAVAGRRPTEFYVYADLGGIGYCVTPVILVPTMPLDVQTAAPLFMDRSFLRRLCFAFGWKHSDWTGRWAWDMDPGSAEARKRTREALGVTSDDIFIPGGYLGERDEMLHRPSEWVQKHLDRIDGRLAEAA